MGFISGGIEDKTAVTQSCGYLTFESFFRITSTGVPYHHLSSIE
jgi:hypothetical protein